MAKKLKGFRHPEGDVFAGIHTAEGVLILDPDFQDETQESQFRLFCPGTKKFVVVANADPGSEFRECTRPEVRTVVDEYFSARQKGQIPRPNPTDDDVLSGKTTKCSSCNNTMPVERLEFAPYCIDCQRGYETTGQSRMKEVDNPNEKIKGTRGKSRRSRKRYDGFGG